METRTLYLRCGCKTHATFIASAKPRLWWCRQHHLLTRISRTYVRKNLCRHC